MIEVIEALLLKLLPLSLFLKTVALAFIWYHLRFHTSPVGPLGQRINISFRDQSIMSACITWAMAILAMEVDASEIDWPYVSIALTGIALWPIRTAWSHIEVYRQYRIIQRERSLTTGE